MLKTSWLLMFPFIFGVVAASAQDAFETDTLKTSAGDLKIAFIGHGTLIFTFGGQIIHVDPYGKLADYAKLPKADMVLITHEHRDHLDADALKPIQTEKTVFITTETCAKSIPGAVVIRNGDVKTVGSIKIEAVPAYNVLHKRPDGQPFHPPGIGNGYVITFGDKRVYVAGDTENIPEIKGLKHIDVAFLPMNLPYTMTPEMVADAAIAFKPKILYPYHYGDTDPALLTALLKDAKDIDVRVRRMK
jgi:L-ascorbate metabolism protein UlaG (beta-lactamase superfamily)